MKTAYRQESLDAIETLQRVRLVNEHDLPGHGIGAVAAMHDLIASQMLAPQASPANLLERTSHFEMAISFASRTAGFAVLAVTILAMIWLFALS
jgi:hypothetical protein